MIFHINVFYINLYIISCVLMYSVLCLNILYVTRSREMSHLSKTSISIFLHYSLITDKCFILMQTQLQLDILLQSYEGLVNAKNNIKQRNLNTVLPISQKQHHRHPTHSSWSCHICYGPLFGLKELSCVISLLCILYNYCSLFYAINLVFYCYV